MHPYNTHTTHTHNYTHRCEFVCVCVCLCLDGALSILIIVKGLAAPPKADGVAKLPPITVGLGRKEF
jgi:hypothetical protein